MIINQDLIPSTTERRRRSDNLVNLNKSEIKIRYKLGRSVKTKNGIPFLKTNQETDQHSQQIASLASNIMSKAYVIVTVLFDAHIDPCLKKIRA